MDSLDVPTDRAALKVQTSAERSAALTRQWYRAGTASLGDFIHYVAAAMRVDHFDRMIEHPDRSSF
jgi:hypothetical protein